MTTAFHERPYEIRASDHRCHECDEEVPCEASYYSAIVYTDDQFVRRDYCLECWTGAGGRTPVRPRGESGELFAYWRARRPPLPSTKPNPMRFDVNLVLDFFRRLGSEAGDAGRAANDAPDDARGDHNSPEDRDAPPAQPPETDARQANEKERLRFVFALLLIRKKVLTLESTVERDGAEWLKVVERKEPKTTSWIRNPTLDAQQLEQVKVKIGELLQMQI